VPPLVEQLEALLAKLRARHPELLGLGFGFRRRRGRIVPEQVVKLQVRRKIRGKHAGVRLFPKTVALRALVLGQSVVVRVPTDVETPRRMRATRFAIDGMTASALASWNDASGRKAFGALTAAHGLPFPGPSAPAVAVHLGDGTQTQGVVVARTSLEQDGLDVGLVRMDVLPAQIGDAGPRTPAIATADQLLQLLSSSSSDDVGAPAESWSSATPTRIRGLAFLLEWQWAGVQATMRRIVQCKASKLGAFRPGTSGSAWVATAATGELAMAIQSHGHEPKFQLAEGTHLATAIEWLAARPGIADLRVAWRVQDLLA